MKIKLSRSQWEKIGNESGWMRTIKTAQNVPAAQPAAQPVQAPAQQPQQAPAQQPQQAPAQQPQQAPATQPQPAQPQNDSVQRAFMISQNLLGSSQRLWNQIKATSANPAQAVAAIDHKLLDEIISMATSLKGLTGK